MQFEWDEKGKNTMMSLQNSKSDFKKLTMMRDEDIDCSDIPEFTEEFLATVEGFIEAPEKELISIRIDKPVLDFYRRTGEGYRTRINAVLRAYAETAERKRIQK
jgi:uncharacterized protein (DUF4415 family)